MLKEEHGTLGAVRTDHNSAEPPMDNEAASLGQPSAVAGGIPAIVSTAKHALAEMGPVRAVRTLARLNQTDGFDCPGCAWPDPDERRSAVEFCENGAKHVASEATRKRIGKRFFKKWSVADLGSQSDLWLDKQGRLTQPMIRRQDKSHYEEISWPDAFSLIAKTLNGLASPDEAVFYTSGRTSNEAAFLYQLLARQFGTNNLPDCSNMCHESSGCALGETIGVGKGTVALNDFELADAIFIIGQNPGTNHPRMLSTLQRAAQRGCQIISINPLIETGNVRFNHPQDVLHLLGSGTALSTLYLQVRINGDVALIKGIMKEMLEQETRHPGRVLDRGFIDEHTEGYEAFAAALHNVSWDDIVRISGVRREEIRQASEVAMKSERMICCWAMGITQHKNAVANIQEIVNFALLRGQIGRPGAGLCPVRGHSNVQGDRTMGICERMPDAFLDRLASEFGFDPPRHHGHDTVASIHAMLRGDAKLFVGLGGNFLSAAPDTHQTARALSNCDLTVQISTKLNRGHLVTGKTALILPCLGRTEIDQQTSGPQVVTVENSMGIVHTSEGRLKPASKHLKSEVSIVCEMAAATLGSKSAVRWADLAASYDKIRDHIERVVPGFESFNTRVRKPGGFVLPNGARERRFQTKNGKAVFTVHPMPQHDLAPGQLMMMTIRSHDHFNTTVYGLSDRYRGIKKGRRVLFMNAEDLKERDMRSGDLVDITSHFGGELRVAKRFRLVEYNVPRGCAASYYPETNVLVHLESVADKSRTPTSKSIVISIETASI